MWGVGSLGQDHVSTLVLDQRRRRLRGPLTYTGVIYETVFKGATQVGSIVAGGRYDNLVGSIVPGKIVPAVGVSLGIERVFMVMQEKQKEEKKQ